MRVPTLRVLDTHYFPPRCPQRDAEPRFWVVSDDGRMVIKIATMNQARRCVVEMNRENLRCRNLVRAELQQAAEFGHVMGEPIFIPSLDDQEYHVVSTCICCGRAAYCWPSDTQARGEATTHRCLKYAR